MGNSGSAASKRRTTEFDESSIEHRHPSDGLQPPRRRRISSGKKSGSEKRALLTSSEVPEALQRLIEDVNMDTVAMQLRRTSISPASTPTGPAARSISLEGSPTGGLTMATTNAFRHRSLSHRVDLEETLAAQGVTMAAVGGEQKLPTVFKWEGGGKEAYVSGSFNAWSAKIQMVKSSHNFYTIVDLPAGRHEYKFIVDGQWRTDCNQAVVDNDFGSTNNVITVKPTDFQVFQALAEDVRQSEEDQRFRRRGRTTSHSENRRSGSPDGEYGQEMPVKNDFLWEIGSRDVPTPPLLPPQMLHVILNKDTSPHYDPNLLPEPNHVMLNHMYALSIKDGVMVLSLIQRYRKKFVTTVLYKPIDAAGIPKAPPPSKEVMGLAAPRSRTTSAAAKDPAAGEDQRQRREPSSGSTNSSCSCGSSASTSTEASSSANQQLGPGEGSA